MTGELGGSEAGLQVTHGTAAGRWRGAATPDVDTPNPVARVAEARALIEVATPHAMIDVSDGLSSDVWHIAEESGVGIRLEADLIPLAPCAVEVAGLLGVDPLELALASGEEFELVAALPKLGGGTRRRARGGGDGDVRDSHRHGCGRGRRLLVDEERRTDAAGAAWLRTPQIEGGGMRILLCILAVLAAASPVVAQTYITSNIATTTTWDLAGSPYVVQGVISLTSLSTLTIDPGVTVKFDAGAHLRTQNGTSINAVGTYDDRILFTSNSGTPTQGDWFAIYLRESPASVFSYCTFEYGQYNLYADRCSSSAYYCTSRYADNGFTCEHGSLLLEGCDVIDNGRGIKIYGPDSYPVIQNCNIYDNYYDNMYVAGYTEAPLVNIDAENNWWGTDVDSEIEDSITISNSPYVEIDYDPWLHEVPVEHSSWGRVKALYAD